MVSAGRYLLGALELLAVLAPLAWSAYRIRAAALPSWFGAPARLVESTLAVALLIWLAELLGTVNLLYPGTLIAAALLTAAGALLLRHPAVSADSANPDAVAASPPPAGGAEGGLTRRAGETPSATGPAGRSSSVPDVWMHAVMLVVIALVVAHWSIIAKDALDRGIFNFDSLWYHMPFAADIARSHSVTGLHYTETVFTNWFYPQNSELLHAVGILLTGRDTLSLFVNFAWLGIAFLAAYCIGRPWNRGPLSVVAAAVLLECHTLVVREPGAAKNDVMAAALVLAAIAILVTAWQSRASRAVPWGREAGPGSGGGAWEEARWAIAAAGLAVGLAAGTKYTVMAMAAALSLAVLVLAPAGRRRAAAAWWFLSALAGGGYWYLRNLVVAGNPLPELKGLGPLSLPHPERLQEGRPDFSIAHYLTDTGVWRHYFEPGLHGAFGALWPVVLLAAVAAALAALLSGRSRALRWVGAVALVGMVAYLFTPLSAAGAEGEPTGFGINIRYVIGPLLAAIVLLPLPRLLDDRRRQWALLVALLALLVLSDRPDVPLRDPSRPFALLVVVLAVAIPALIWLLWRRGARRSLLAAGATALLVAVVALGYPLQRHYLQQRFANRVAGERIPGMDLDSAYRWARGVEGARIGLAGTTAGFLEYGFFGPDLSNRVLYLGRKGPHGSYQPIPTCAGFRAAVNAADLDYLVTSPFLDFLDPGHPIPSPEARWLRGQDAVRPLLSSGPVTVWRIDGTLDPSACGIRNAPLREIPGRRR